SYRTIGVPDGHHDLSHHGGDPAQQAGGRGINRFHATPLAYLLEKLKSIPPGGRTFLDHCMIAHRRGSSDAHAPSHRHPPILLAGKGRGTIKTGRHVRYPRGTPLTNLYLSMLDRIGAPLGSFGDSTGRLESLDG